MPNGLKSDGDDDDGTTKITNIQTQNERNNKSTPKNESQMKTEEGEVKEKATKE